MEAGGNIYHKLCFKCSACKNKLQSELNSYLFMKSKLKRSITVLYLFKLTHSAIIGTGIIVEQDCNRSHIDFCNESCTRACRILAGLQSQNSTQNRPKISGLVSEQNIF